MKKNKSTGVIPSYPPNALRTTLTTSKIKGFNGFNWTSKLTIDRSLVQGQEILLKNQLSNDRENHYAIAFKVRLERDGSTCG